MIFCKICGNELNSGSSFCKNCGEKIASPNQIVATKNNFFSWLKKRIGLIIGIIFFGFLLLIIVASLSNETSNDTGNNQVVLNSATQNEIAQSVVNIFCPSTVSDEDVSGGSGTIITEDGVILTNSHIIPQDETNIHVDEQGCLVVLPDPITGQTKDVYLAHPIVINSLSDKYDLAYMEIYAAYYDEDKKEYAGVYPRKFPAFDDTTRCKNENVQLGESVRIFGYPAISGGYSLTITDGVVSSFPGEDLIVTSAKISHGNSGGLAVDRYGCMIGIPSMVSSDEAESLGVIISMPLVNKFSNEVSTYLDSLK